MRIDRRRYRYNHKIRPTYILLIHRIIQSRLPQIPKIHLTRLINKIIQLLYPTAVVVFIYLFTTSFTANVEASIRRELGGYVTKVEFEEYKREHQKWGEEVIKRIDSALLEVKDTTKDTNSQIRELLKVMSQRPPPPRQNP